MDTEKQKKTKKKKPMCSKHDMAVSLDLRRVALLSLKRIKNSIFKLIPYYTHILKYGNIPFLFQHNLIHIGIILKKDTV